MAWHYICQSAEIPKNSLKQFSAAGVSLIIANYGGGYRAFPPICPHMEEPLAESGVIANCVLTCTKHLWAWNLNTMEMLGETEKPLGLYEVKEEDGKLLAFVDNEIIYEFGDDDGDDDDFFKN